MFFIIACVFFGYDDHKRQRVLPFQWFPKPRTTKIPFDDVYFVANAPKTMQIPFHYVRVALTETEQVQIPCVFVCSVVIAVAGNMQQQ